MEKWFRDALQARMRDDLRRAHRGLDALERVHANVAKRAIDLLSESHSTPSGAGGSGNGVQARKQLDALQRALVSERDRQQRRYHLMFPADDGGVGCGEELQRAITELRDRFQRVTSVDIPQCMAVLGRIGARGADTDSGRTTNPNGGVL